MFRNVSITEILIAINFVLFLISSIFSGIYANFGLIPIKFFDGEIWRLITSMFLHGGIFHIIMN
ncbi:MAG: rhomboid family intramembrane serine protease, partial [Candidatus Altarchaeaceae archaeon]